LSFANISDLLELLNTSQPQAEQDDVPRKRHGEPAYPVCDVRSIVPQRRSDDEKCDQLNEMLAFPDIIIIVFFETLFMVSVLYLVVIAIDLC
jgi:hypothetical protein